MRFLGDACEGYDGLCQNHNGARGGYRGGAQQGARSNAPSSSPLRWLISPQTQTVVERPILNRNSPVKEGVSFVEELRSSPTNEII